MDINHAWELLEPALENEVLLPKFAETTTARYMRIYEYVLNTRHHSHEGTQELTWNARAGSKHTTR